MVLRPAADIEIAITADSAEIADAAETTDSAEIADAAETTDAVETTGAAETTDVAGTTDAMTDALIAPLVVIDNPRVSPLVMTDLTLSTQPDLISMRSMRSWSRSREVTQAPAAPDTPITLAIPTGATTSSTV